MISAQRKQKWTLTNNLICRHGNNTESREQILHVASKLLANPQRGLTSDDKHINLQAGKE